MRPVCASNRRPARTNVTRASRTGSCADSVARHASASATPRNRWNLWNPWNLVLDIVSSDVDDEVLRARGADVLRVVDLVRADDADVAWPETVRLAGNRQLHHAIADQHHLLAQMLMGRMVHFTRRDVALMGFDFESRVRLRREHPALLVLAVG